MKFVRHHRPDEPWTDSTRRTLLLRLLNGLEDWTVDSAAFGLCVSAPCVRATCPRWGSVRRERTFTANCSPPAGALFGETGRLGSWWGCAAGCLFGGWLGCVRLVVLRAGHPKGVPGTWR